MVSKEHDRMPNGQDLMKWCNRFISCMKLLFKAYRLLFVRRGNNLPEKGSGDGDVEISSKLELAKAMTV